ncbi:MAG: nuclear transport factor 2 family protein [Actinomycetota bacterium]|nr:nuclear transport factor 2 family protein [Actinomycetota bacterium]
MPRDPIAELVHLYADAVVHHDGDQWGATWAEDAHWELGRGRRVEGRDAILQLWQGAMGGFHAVVQTVLNGTYELDEAAGTGAGRWYIQEHFHRAGGEDGNGDKGKLLAHYDDTYKRVEGQWLFASRELVIHYGGPQDLSGAFLNAWDPA